MTMVVVVVLGMVVVEVVMVGVEVVMGVLLR